MTKIFSWAIFHYLIDVSHVFEMKNVDLGRGIAQAMQTYSIAIAISILKLLKLETKASQHAINVDIIAKAFHQNSLMERVCEREKHTFFKG